MEELGRDPEARLVGRLENQDIARELLRSADPGGGRARKLEMSLVRIGGLGGSETLRGDRVCDEVEGYVLDAGRRLVKRVEEPVDTRRRM